MVSIRDAFCCRLVYEDVALGRNCLANGAYATYPDRYVNDTWVHRRLMEEDPCLTVHGIQDRPRCYMFPIGLFHNPGQWAGAPVNVREDLGPGQGPLMHVPSCIMDDARSGRVLFILDQSQEGNGDPALWDWFYAHMGHHGIPCDRVLYLTSDHLAEDTHRTYCDQRGISQRMHVISTLFNRFTWPLDCMRNGTVGPDYDSAMVARTSGVTALYNCLNRVPHKHRCWMFMELLHRDLLTHGLVSMPALRGMPICQGLPHLDSVAMAAAAMTPMVVDRSDFHNNMYNNINEDIYLGSWFSVITDTYVDGSQLFIGEKIFKPMWCSSPFLLLGSPGTLRRLRQLGFMTYPMLWDESYDDIHDVESRITAICAQIETILGIRDKKSWMDKARDAIEHNREMLLKPWIGSVDHARILGIWHDIVYKAA